MDNGLAIELISEYNDWVTRKRAMAGDVSPETFMVERAQATALERLIKVSEYLDSLTDQKDFRVKAVRRIIDG